MTTSKCKTLPYHTKSGAIQIKPSLEFAMELAESEDGFCLACGKTQAGVEPDARQYVCECCGASKVYGAEELVLMGLTF